MKMILPATVTAATLTETNVAITETEWTPGTYNTGDQRYVGEDLYEVVADPSTTDEPTEGAAADPPSWLNVGKINRFKMFDGILGNATVQSGGNIDFKVESGLITTGVAFFGLVANSVQVIVTHDTEGEVYNRTVSRRGIHRAPASNWRGRHRGFNRHRGFQPQGSRHLRAFCNRGAQVFQAGEF